MEVSPTIFEHAARMIGRSPWEASRDGNLMFASHAAAYEYYRHGPVMPGIDIYNLEAEAYGAVVGKPGGHDMPAVRIHPLSDAAGLLGLRPLDPSRDGRLSMQIDVARRLAERFPEADVRVPVSGPFSIASNLVGFDRLLLEAAVDPGQVARALQHLVEGQVRFARAIRESGLGVSFFESAACPPLLSPRLFREVEAPALVAAMAGIADVMGHAIPCIIGGNTAPIVDAMLETGTGYLVAPFETDQEAFMTAVAGRPEVRVRINMDLRIVASGTPAEIEAEAERVIALACNRPNTCLGTGVLPYETRPENMRFLMEYVARRTA